MPPALPRIHSLARSQLGLFRALWRAPRGRTDVRPPEVAIPYNGSDRAVLWTITVLSVIEIAIVHVLVSWPALRWTVLVVSVYGLLAFVGFHFTMCQHPHLLRGGVLVLRFGHFRSARVPLDTLTSVSRAVENTHKKNLAVVGDGLVVAFMGGTNVELRFSPDAVVDVEGRQHTVSRISFLAEDPRTATRLLGAHVRTG